MKIIILGGVAGGASTATRCRRLDEQAEIIVFEKGEYVSYANCGLPYYIGDVIPTRDHLLLETPESFRTRYNIDVRLCMEITKIDTENKMVHLRHVKTDETCTENYDKLVLSPGAKPIIPPVEGVDNQRVFTLRNIPDTDAVKDFVSTRSVKRAMIIGGGFIGLEMAENLHNLGLSITLLELDRQVFPSVDYSLAKLVQRELEKNRVEVLLQKRVVRFEDIRGEAIAVHLHSGEKIVTDMVILGIGVKPDVEMIQQSGIATGLLGGIKVNEYLQTSHPDVYAVGDAIEVNNLISNKPMLLPLAGAANKQGRIAASNIILGNKERFEGVIGTAIAKVFSLTVAKAGLSSKQLEHEKTDYISSYTHSMSHAGYYPEALPLTIKLLFSPDDGRLYGGEIVGCDGVDKRIEMIAQTIQHKGTVSDLANLEHAYAPPYSSVKDAVNIAGFAAENILSGKMKIIHAKDISPNDYLLDVRTA
ncbi:MAG: FAD-dependent oxidoreductase, partial [Bacteroidales bacterium]|nr:FAD-dependent oxidoreductase [Bacteroidales bacterium]